MLALHDREYMCPEPEGKYSNAPYNNKKTTVMSNYTSLDEPQLLVSISDPSLLGKLKNEIKMLNGVSAISVLKPKKTELEMAREDAAEGRVTQWSSVDEMFDTVLN